MVPAKPIKTAAHRRNRTDSFKNKAAPTVAQTGAGKTSSGGIGLVNKGQVGKAHLIARQDRTGVGQRKAYKVGPQSVVAVPSKGMAGVGLVGEIACP